MKKPYRRYPPEHNHVLALVLGIAIVATVVVVFVASVRA